MEVKIAVIINHQTIYSTDKYLLFGRFVLFLFGGGIYTYSQQIHCECCDIIFNRYFELFLQRSLVFKKVYICMILNRR